MQAHGGHGQGAVHVLWGAWLACSYVAKNTNAKFGPLQKMRIVSGPLWLTTRVPPCRVLGVARRGGLLWRYGTGFRRGGRGQLGRLGCGGRGKVR